MVVLDHICKSFGETIVLDQISIQLNEKNTLGLIGESGCGKTTMLRIIAGLEMQDSGVLTIDNKIMNSKIEPCDRNVAMVFQDATLWNFMNISRNISFGMKKRDQMKINEIARALSIDELLQRYPEEISGGQAKRVSLARAFASDKDILLLDEPLSNIDEATKYRVLQYIKENLMGKKTMIIVTHDKSELEYLGCEIMEL